MSQYRTPTAYVLGVLVLLAVCAVAELPFLVY